MNFENTVKQFIRDFRLELVEKESDTDFLLLGDRCGDEFFTPRQNEEDDDCPDFDCSKVIHWFKDQGFNVSSWDHEKGYFSISLSV